MSTKMRMKKNVGFKELSFKDKVGHIWEYYHIHILVALFLLLAVVPIMVNMFTKPATKLTILMINASTMDDSFQTSPINEESFRPFFEENGYEYYDGIVTLNANMFFHDITQSTDSISAQLFYQENAEQSQLLYATLAVGNLDLFFGTGPYFTTSADMGVLADLNEILPQELLTRCEKLLVFTDEGGESEPYPCAVQLPPSDWLASIGYPDGCSIGIMASAIHPELAKDFVVYLLSSQ